MLFPEGAALASGGGGRELVLLGAFNFFRMRWEHLSIPLWLLCQELDKILTVDTRVAEGGVSVGHLILVFF